MVVLGFFIGVKNSQLLPRQTIKFLGMLMDINDGRFKAPKAKIDTFKELAQSIISAQTISNRDLDRVAG